MSGSLIPNNDIQNTTNFPSLELVAGRHLALYEAYMTRLDPNRTGQVQALDAAKFLKKSGLSDAILSKIWDLADYNSTGSLDKIGLFICLKLIALAQNGKKLDMAIIGEDSTEPKLGSDTLTMPPTMPLPPTNVSPHRSKFLQFAVNNKIPGPIARDIMMSSKLPVDKLGQIWDMADTDKDGELSENEFYICLDLLEKARVALGIVPPTSIPPQQQQHHQPPPIPQPPVLVHMPPPIIPPTPPVAIAPPVMIPPPVQIAPQPVPMPQQQQMPPPSRKPFEIKGEMRNRFENMFLQADIDKDGYVNGMEIKDLFLQTGLNQQILAQIWNLSDTEKSGKLTFEEFAVSMWLVEAVIKDNYTLPMELEPKMSEFIKKSVNETPEYQMISREFAELNDEKEKINFEIMNKGSEKKIKSGEIASLSSELDNLTATLKQLENQKNLANMKLGELEAQVINLRGQSQEQEETLEKTESENREKGEELGNLQKEQQEVENELIIISTENERLNDRNTNYQLSINNFKTRQVDLDLLKETMTHLISKFDKCIENNDFYNLIEADLRDFGEELEEFEEEYQAKINQNDPFGDGANKLNTEVKITSPEKTPTSANATSKFSSAFGDSFGDTTGGFASSWNAPDPFAAASISHDISPFSPGKDPFGSEPFQPPQPQASPSPTPPHNMPPKKGPPSRPPPPKNVPARPPPPKFQQPTPPPQAITPELDFADFSQFDQFASSSTSSKFVSSTSPLSLSNNSSSILQDFTEDPFKNYRYDFTEADDPFK